MDYNYDSILRTKKTKGDNKCQIHYHKRVIKIERERGSKIT
jgi:hypothetical protein